MTLTVAFLLILNFGISWWNAYSCGKIWIESRIIGGWLRIVVWSGAVMSAIGFSMVYTFLIAWVGYEIGYLPPEVAQLVIEFWFIAAVPPILASGIIITINSWQSFFRTRSLVDLGVASWNTYAQLHNMYAAFDGMGKALSHIGEFAEAAFSRRGGRSKDEGKALALVIAILLALIGVILGILTTAVLIQRYAATTPMPVRAEVRR